jgi:arylsulfatase A-like enzyme
MTGRQSVRSGTYTVIPGAGKTGLTPWEYTIAKLLSDAGYAHIDVGQVCAVPFVFEYRKSIAEYPNIKPREEFTGYPKVKSAAA